MAVTSRGSSADRSRLFGRRRALAALGLGAGALALPFTGLLDRRRIARADAPLPTAKRLVVFYTPNGSVHSYRRPLDGQGKFDLASSPVLSPLIPVAEHLVFVDGLQIPGNAEHEEGQRKMLTNLGGPSTRTAGRSVDQFVADELAASTMFRSLELGVQSNVAGGLTHTRMCYAGPDDVVPPDDDPQSVFTRMFSGVSIGGDEDPEVARMRAHRLAVLDTVERDAEDLRARLGSPEKAKLDQHIDSLHDLAATLQATGLGGPGCQAPDAPPALDLFDHANIPTIGKLQMDLLITALACNMTRVGSLQWTYTQNPHVFSWLGHSESIHDLSHGPDEDVERLEQFVAGEIWYAEQFRYFVERLAATPDPENGGSLLDTTLVVWPKEMGDSRFHRNFDVSWVLAGSAEGRFATGSYHRFDDVFHSRMLVTICQAMGIDVETYGDPNAVGGFGELLG